MGYQVLYESVGKMEKPKPEKHRISGVLAVVMICVLVIGAVAVKAGALPWVKEYLIPGDPDVTAAALQDMVAGLQSGEPLGEAITAFCREIVAHAG